LEILSKPNHREHSVAETQPKDTTQITQIKQIKNLCQKSKVL